MTIDSLTIVFLLLSSSITLETRIMILSTEKKNQVLKDLAELIAANSHEVIAQNQLDLNKVGDLDMTLVDRLKVDESKVVLLSTCCLKWDSNLT